jgi:hypothetical protein
MSTSGQLVGISEITAVRQFRLGVDRTLGCTVYDFVAIRASKIPQINNCLLSGNLASRSTEGLGSELHALFFSSALRFGRVGLSKQGQNHFCWRLFVICPELGLFPRSRLLARNDFRFAYETSKSGLLVPVGA